jgi:selenocysteine lyase/cysteine desulfurase
VGLYNLLAAEVVVLGADEGFSHWQSDLQETVRPADVGWHWHRYLSLSSGLNWNDSGTNSADGETSLVGSVVSTAALVELQEEEEEEEEQPVRRQMLVVLMLEVLERGKKKEVVAKNMQEVGDADADDGQSWEVEVAGELILMGRCL